MSDDLDKLMSQAEIAVEGYRSDPSAESADEVDRIMTHMRYLLGDERMDNLHWLVAHHADAIRYLDKLRRPPK